MPPSRASGCRAAPATRARDHGRLRLATPIASLLADGTRRQQEREPRGRKRCTECSHHHHHRVGDAGARGVQASFGLPQSSGDRYRERCDGVDATDLDPSTRHRGDATVAVHDETGIGGVHCQRLQIAHRCGAVASSSPSAGLDVTVTSAGTRSVSLSVDVEAVHAMGQRGVDISGHVPRQLDRAILDHEGADLIVTMTREHLRTVATSGRMTFPRTFTLREVVRRASSYDGGQLKWPE